MKKINEKDFIIKKQGDFTAVINRRTLHKEIVLTKRFKELFDLKKERKTKKEEK